MNGTFNYYGETVKWERKRYQSNGANAVVINSLYGEPIATLSCNLPEVTLDEDEFCVKTWSENEEIARMCRPLFIDTGLRVNAGYAMAKIWKFKPSDKPE